MKATIPTIFFGLAKKAADHQTRKRLKKCPRLSGQQRWQINTALWRALDEHGVKINRCRSIHFMLYEMPMSWLETHLLAYLNYCTSVHLMTPTRNWQYGDVRSKREAKQRAMFDYYDSLAEFKLFNSMCGKDVIKVYARQGSWNWSDTDHHDYADEVWYAGSIDDGLDPSYADIYVKRFWNQTQSNAGGWLDESRS